MSTHSTSGSSWGDSWKKPTNRPVNGWEASFDAKPVAYRPSSWSTEPAYQPPPTQADNWEAFNNRNGGNPQTPPFNPMMAFDPKASSYQPDWLAKSPVSNPDYANLSFLDKPAIGYTPGSGAVSNFGQSMDGAAPAGDGGWLKSISNWSKENGLLDSVDTVKGTKTQGLLGAGIGAANSIFNAYMGMKQYGLAKEQFKFNKDMTTRNFNAQANMTNSTLADRQGGRVSARGGQDVASYMSQYGVQKI